MTQPQNFLRNLIGRTVTAASAAAVIGLATPAVAATKYDGLWSVVIITEKGECERAYRYPVRISNGILVNANNDGLVISGKVVSSGAVTVAVSSGDQSARGLGRLAGGAGIGTWRASSCAGTWEAKRHR